MELAQEGSVVVGTYIRQTGVLVIDNVTPLKMHGAVTAGVISLHVGKIYLNGTMIGEGQICKTLETGLYVVGFGEVPGFIAPLVKTMMIKNASSETITAVYVPKFQNISVGVAKQLMESDPAIQVIDVRGPDDYKAGHIEGAINIPIATLEQGMNELDIVKSVIIYCGSGTSSILGAGTLQEAGFMVYHMDGGIMDWVSSGYSLIKEG